MHSTGLVAESRRGMAFVSLSGVLWGTIGITAQAIYHQAALGSLAVGFYRLALGLPLVALACWLLVGRKIFLVRRRHYLQMCCIGAMLALYQVAYFSAISYVGVTIATLVTLCTAPVMVSLASVLVFREALTRHTLGALALAVLGTGLLVGTSGSAGQPTQLLSGLGLALLSAGGYAIVALLGRSLAGACHPIHSTAVSFSVGALILLPFLLLEGQSAAYPGAVWGLLFYLGLIPTALGYVLFFLGVNSIRASTAAILTMLEPLVATFLAWQLFAERLEPLAMVGAVLLLTAITVLYRGAGSVVCAGG
jgi:drug/metabolite transporter, DME family